MFVWIVASALMAWVNAATTIPGEETTIQEFPFLAALEVDNRLKCGGVIVGPTFVLTAAQCTERIAPLNKLKVRVGSTRSLQDGELHEVQTVTQFPLVTKSKEFDVAVIALAEPISFGATAQPVTIIGDSSEPQPGETLTVVGWGSNNEEQSTVLRKMNLPATETETCRQTLAADLNIKITNSMICAGENVQQHYSFKGETGGPLFNAKKELVGIASWDVPTINLDYPKAFNNIAHDHINEFVRKYSILWQRIST